VIKENKADTGLDSGSAVCGEDWMQEFSQKMRCGIFGKSRTGCSSHVPERFFGEVTGKIFGEIVLEKIG
jgi:hypothetical protein